MPFPIGYNEDWNWCLLQSILKKTTVISDGLPAYHSPSKLFHPDQIGIFWESLGEIILYSLLRARKSTNNFTLSSLQKFIIHNIADEYVLHELSYTRNLLNSFLAKERNLSNTQKMKKYLLELHSTIDCIKKQNLPDYVKIWFDTQNHRTKTLSYILKKNKIQDIFSEVLDRNIV